MLALFVLALFFFVLANGTADIAVLDVWHALSCLDESNQTQLILRTIRLPRVLGAFLVGSSFALSGALMQGVTRNPLADSGLLGINAGASFAMVISFAFWPDASSAAIFLWSFFGSLLVTLFVFGFLSFSKMGMNPIQLVLAGVAINSFFTAISQALTQLFDLQQDFAFWFVGGAANITWHQLSILGPVYFLAACCAFLLGRSVSLVNLSEAHALALGGHPARIRLIAFGLVAVLAALAVSLVGPVSFIGLMVPPIVRGIFGSDYRYVLPASFLLGGGLVMLADFAARMVNPPFETPFGLVIALIGVPFLLFQVRREPS
ncbi:ferrichrome transport system permease FhuB [Enterococcus ratti]|uniref:Ferrichrome transport system permease FhuB n=1 Tax=Enterococcus ratti TaxID=150033 RepID=A0A1L8WIH8_9ENTE|nr:ferrichrome transport system permease FhuB [Enterococcus ratti]